MTTTECMTTDEHGRQMREYGSCNACGMGATPSPVEGATGTCVHCQAKVTLRRTAYGTGARLAWHDGQAHPFYCPKALDLTHHVLDVTA